MSIFAFSRDVFRLGVGLQRDQSDRSQGGCMDLGQGRVLAALLAALVAGGCGGGGASNAAAPKSEPVILSPNLTTGEAAVRVIGQPDFTSSSENQGGAPGLQTMGSAYGAPALYNNSLYVPDSSNNRILGFTQGIPQQNGEAATFVIGQDSDSASASGTGAGSFYQPAAMLIHKGKLLVADWKNNRVLIWNQVPTAGTADADLVLGQADMNAKLTDCSASGMSAPVGLAIFGDKLLVSDLGNDRILVWEGWPVSNGQAADAVIGQDDLVSCGQDRGEVAVNGRGFNAPAFLWSDGQRLAVPDIANNRVLIWNSWPGIGADMRAADRVLGQQDLQSNGHATSSTGMYGPEAVTFDGKRLFVSDSSNNRVLIWDQFPATNGVAASVVIGQPDFDTAAWPAAGPASFDYPGQVASIQGKLFVSDNGGHRVLIFE